MLNGYSKTGSVNLARDLFDRNPEKDGVSCGTMIAGYVQEGWLKDALIIYREMLKSGSVPDEVMAMDLISLQTWWFEVCGEVEFPLPAGTYSLFFRLQLGKSTKRFGRRVCNSQNVHGWNTKPVQFQISTS
ncbi:hypothetical protein AgCh_023974 [Apium graveolens]